MLSVITIQAQQAATILSLLVACTCVHLHSHVINLPKLFDRARIATA